MTFVNRVASSSSRLALALVLLASVAETPGQLAFFLRPSQPVIRLWSDPDAQYRLQLGEVPYDLLRVADAAFSIRNLNENAHSKSYAYRFDHTWIQCQ